MKVYVVLIDDRHADPEIVVFEAMCDAKEYAWQTANKLCHRQEGLREEQFPDVILHIEYSCEDDCVEVFEREVK